MSDRSDTILVSSKDFFNEIVQEAFHQRKFQTLPQVKTYLVSLLEFYMDARNFHEKATDEAGKKIPQTLAEMYMIAQNSEPSVKLELLRKMADRSLYVAGFFADSFSRKIIDVDYYVGMGGTAYAELSYHAKEDALAKVYSIFSKKFVPLMDILTYISQKSAINKNENLLRLYDRYLKTGSELARETLIEQGVFTIPDHERRKGVKIS